jgi:hypothetical protein
MTDAEIEKVANEIIGHIYTELASIAIGAIVGLILFRLGLWIHWHLS